MFGTVLWHSKSNTELRVPPTGPLFKYEVFGNSVHFIDVFSFIKSGAGIYFGTYEVFST